MPIGINVQQDIREVERMLVSLEGSAGKRAIANAINDTTKSARSKSIKQVAKDIKLARKYVAYRFNVRGEKKGDRARLLKAYPNRLTSDLIVYMRGIPVFQIANKAPPTGKQRKGGVKAKGGRFYKGSFYAPYWGSTKVFKRMTRARYPVMIPKVGVRKRLDKEFTKYTSGRLGRSTFSHNYDRHIRNVLRRLNG
jgi:hypothetical protein